MTATASDVINLALPFIIIIVFPNHPSYYQCFWPANLSIIIIYIVLIVIYNDEIHDL